MSKTPLRIFSQAWRLPALTSVLGAILSLLFSLAVTPLQYSSTLRVLITQPGATGLDPYTASKATERIAQSLSELIYSSTFADNVLNQTPGFYASYFPSDEYAKRKAWNSSIETSVAAGTGIMTLVAYHPNPDQARILADAVSRELALQAPNYFGYAIRVQVIDAPLTSRWFARPNLLANGLFGFFLGFLIGAAWILTRFTHKNQSGLS